MSEISKQALKVDNSTSFPNNTTGYISPTILRAFNVNMIDSLVEQAGYTANSASWNVSIGALNTYTSSFAPSLTQLNAFTASQLTINTGVNQFTQSAGASITNLNTFSSSFNTYTASINQIRSNGVVLGTSTIFNLVGPGTFFSASLVQNVQGNIATLTFTSDNAKLNTSSFNDYTASTAATQSVFSASVATSFSASNATFSAFSASQNNFNLSATASLVQLLNLSSSLSGGYATQGELDQSASVLQSNINQKLFTSSFNAYTQSFANTFNAYTSSQKSLNTTFLTTGSASGSQSTLGAFNMNMMYTSSFGQAAVTSSAGFVYFDYSIFNQPEMQFWTTSDGQTFVNAGAVKISGSGVANQSTNLNFDYQEFAVGIPVTGSGLNGATYTLTGPYYHDLTITGSVTTTYAQQVVGLDGRKTVQDANGIYAASADNLIQAGTSVDGGVYSGNNSNGNYISLAATSSQVTDSNGNPTSFNTPQIAVSQNNSGSFTQIAFQGNDNYTDGTITINQPLSISGSTSISGALQVRNNLRITGSVFQNVSASTITSATASIDLNVANYFTLTLVGATRINVTNVSPGVTATLVVRTGLSGSATFSSNVKQVSGSAYQASPSGNIDIISLTAVDTSSVYLVPAYTFV